MKSIEKPIIRLSKLGVEFSGSPRRLRQLRDEFNRRNHIRLKSLLDPDLLRVVRDRAERAKYRNVTHRGVGHDQSLADKSTCGLIRLLLSGEDFLQLLRDISSCGPIDFFHGRIYRFIPGKRTGFDWHDDRCSNRLLAITINLSETPYVGGCLKLRRTGRGGRVQSVPNTGFGDAVVFQIGEHLEHRVTAIGGNVSKIALAGWFYAPPEKK